MALLFTPCAANAHGGPGGWHGNFGGWRGGPAWHGNPGWHGHHHHVHGGVFIGVPLFPAPVYAPPVYYPPIVTIPATPPVYVERSDDSAAASGWWYYCPSARAYYPNVTQCPQGWEKVAPQAPPPQ